jgi:hypothetical protein
MRIVEWRRPVLAFALVFGTLAAWGAPALAGDDEDCFNTGVGSWTVWYDSTCTKEISRTLTSGTRKIFTSLTFPAGAAQGPGAFAVYDQSSSVNLPAIASSVEASVDGRGLGTTAGMESFAFSEASSREIFATLRQGRSVYITVRYSSDGAIVFTLDGANFEGAYQRLLQG